MLSSAVLSYRLGTNSREGKKKKWFESTNGSISPRPWSAANLLYTYRHTATVYYISSARPHAHTVPWWLYIVTRVHAALFMCAQAAGDRVVTGEGGGWRGASPGNAASQERSWARAWVRSFTSEGEERSVPSWDGKGEFNLPSLLSQLGHPKTWHWPPKLPDQ